MGKPMNTQGGTNPPSPDGNVIIKLKPHELQDLLNLLSELPYGQCYKMISNIAEQGIPQAEQMMGGK